MKGICRQIVPGLLSICLLVACTVSGNPGATAVPSPQIPKARTAISATPQPALTVTGIPIPSEGMRTPAGVFGNPEQITDGELKLSIKDFAEKCYLPGDSIPLTLAYENLIAAPLTIVDYDAVSTHILWHSQGQVFPVLRSGSRDSLSTPDDLKLVEVFNPNSPHLYELPAGSVLEVPMDYPLPTEILTDGQESSRVEPLPAGRYLLKFIYRSNTQDRSLWRGIISSNQIEICIVN